MNLLHTSDWHLGCTLCGRRRYDESEAFLTWLISTIQSEQIDVLVVSGDIFDSATPSTRAMELYYRFLGQISKTCCNHVVITAGNHDSPSFLSAPKDLLRYLDIHVIGSLPSNRSDEVITLVQDTDVIAIICAVPYLRDKDMRTAIPGESADDRRDNLLAGIRNHYLDVCSLALEQRNAIGRDIPIIATGHLVTMGGIGKDDEGVRDLWIGGCAEVIPDSFPDVIDYLALGHLHQSQQVGESPFKRYSGSPLPIGFGEASHQKTVTIVSFSPESAVQVTECPVPRFRDLISLKGEPESIKARLLEEKMNGRSCLMEITLEDGYHGMLTLEELHQMVEGSRIEILRVKNSGVISKTLSEELGMTVEDLDEIQVFDQCLKDHQIPEDQFQGLKDAYREILTLLKEADGEEGTA